MKLDRLPWINVAPYGQVLTDLISSCQQRDVNLICVQGPYGSGKSRILTELLSELSLDKTVGLMGISGRDYDVFYHNLKTTLKSLEIQSDDFLQEFSEVLELAIQNQSHFYMLMDDAEALPYEIFTGIVNLLSTHKDFNQKVTLVAFMGMMPIHLDIHSLLASAKILTLKGMSISQAKQFIDKVYHCTHQTKSLTMSEVNHLHGLSYGYAGRLIKLLEQSLVSVDETKTHKRWWPFVVIISLPLVGIFLWFQHDAHETMVADQVPEEAPVLITKEVVPVKIVLPLPKVEVAEPILVGPVLVESNLVKVSELPDETLDHSSDKKTMYNYVIELNRHESKTQLEKSLQGRSIPGQAHFTQIEDNGSKIWVAYIGPYGNEEQAKLGKSKLPASLQSLPLKVRKEF